MKYLPVVVVAALVLAAVVLGQSAVRPTPAPPAAWEHAQLAYSRSAKAIVWMSPTQRLTGSASKVITDLGGTPPAEPDLGDVLHYAGSLGWELVAVNHDAPDQPTELWLKRPAAR